jgi:hypothetical protein
MKIGLIVEGDTEVAFRDALRRFLEPRLAGRMPKLDPVPYHGRIPTREKLRRAVAGLLAGAQPADAVIALTDVYTGTREFEDAADAKTKMRNWAGEEPRFFPHAAQHDFEAWLLPYWDTIQRLARHNKAAPGSEPERVNRDQPPSARIAEVFQAGRCRNHYSKVRDGKRILRDVNLLDAANKCPELRLLLNTILSLCGGQAIPEPER